MSMIDIEPKSNISTENKDEKSLWNRSDNSFKFNFLQDNSTEIQHKASSSLDQTVSTTRNIYFTEEGTTFAFNFKIDAEEKMDTSEISVDTSSMNQHCTEVEDPPLQQTSAPQDAPESSKSKTKKKKTGKNKASNDTKPQQPSESAEDKQGSEDTEMNTEEQLQRQLDWCIEQLEHGMRSQKATPKQKEEASRALKTLRSSKAPLVKKRQVMRAMAGDYRKKMEEEKSKQYKLIQNETASAQVKAVSELPKKSVFHRRAGIQSPPSEGHSLPNDSQASTSQHEMIFVLTPSKEEFHFNFL